MPSDANFAAAAAAKVPFRLDQQAFESEIRIEQSMHLVAQTPTLVFGNIIGALIGFLIFVDYVPGWLSALWLWLPLLCTPMALSWLKLRTLPRPASVSVRRIRSVTVYSAALGLSWLVLLVVFLSNQQATPPSTSP